MASRRPFMPLYIADYRMDTLDFSTEQHGAYFLLLMEAWHKGGSLPKDEESLARIAGLTLKKWRVVGPRVMAKFVDLGDRYEHKRINRELTKVQALSEKRSSAGRAGGRPARQTGRPFQTPQSQNSEQEPAQSKGSENQMLSSPRVHAPVVRPRLETPDIRIESPTGDSMNAPPPKSGDDTPPDGGWTLTPPEDKPLEKPKPKKIATRLAEDWQPDEKFRLEAIRLGLPKARVDDVAERFRDWSLSSPNGVKLNWLAAWRNWVKSELERPASAARAPPPRAGGYAADMDERGKAATDFLDQIIKAGKG